MTGPLKTWTHSSCDCRLKTYTKSIKPKYRQTGEGLTKSQPIAEKLLTTDGHWERKVSFLQDVTPESFTVHMQATLGALGGFSKEKKAHAVGRELGRDLGKHRRGKNSDRFDKIHCLHVWNFQLNKRIWLGRVTSLREIVLPMLCWMNMSKCLNIYIYTLVLLSEKLLFTKADS